MSTTGLEIFDSSLQRTHIWLDEIMEELGPDRAFAWHVLGAVLHAIRDRLPVELNAHFAAQLPLIVRGQFYDQWTPGAEAKPARSHEAFLKQIQDGMKGGRTVEAAGLMKSLSILSCPVGIRSMSDVRRIRMSATAIRYSRSTMRSSVPAGCCRTMSG